MSDFQHLWVNWAILIPAAYAVLGAALGHLAPRRELRVIALAGLGACILGGATVAFIVHLSSTHAESEVGYFMAMVLSLAIPAALPFAVAWLSVHHALARSTRLIATCVASLVGLLAFPISVLFFICGLAGDCP